MGGSVREGGGGRGSGPPPEKSQVPIGFLRILVWSPWVQLFFERGSHGPVSRGAYCVPYIHNMLPHKSGAYCVGHVSYLHNMLPS